MLGIIDQTHGKENFHQGKQKESSNKNYAKDNPVKSDCENILGRFYT